MDKRKQSSKVKPYNYVYRVTHKTSGMHYSGVRSSYINPLSDIGIKYFTTSKDKDFQNEFRNYPERFKIKIVRTFATREEAGNFEVAYHTRLNVKDHPKFYNRGNQTSTLFDVSGTVAARSKGSSDKYRRIPQLEYYDNIELYETPSNGKFGNKNPNYGNKMSQKSKDSISEYNKGIVSVIEISSSENIRISQKDFDDSPELYKGVASDTITVRDLTTGDFSRVDRRTYNNDPNLVGVTEGISCNVGEVTVYNRITGEKVKTTVKDYAENKDKYIHPTQDKINYIDTRDGSSGCIDRNTFEKTDYFVGIRRKVACPICGEAGIGKAFRALHFNNCTKDNDEI